jgi:CHASE3 domain sensor protein
MGRPAKQKLRSPVEIEAEIADDLAQHALLHSDLRDALIAGEDTRPYRQAIVEIGEKVADLRNTLAGLNEAESERRRTLAAATALEIAGEAQRRHAELMSRLQVPSFPLNQGEFYHDQAA